ncbi:MAG: hypothetical protein WKG32_21940 [Gemmatimonadaceae bacterium]
MTAQMKLGMLAVASLAACASPSPRAAGDSSPEGLYFLERSAAAGGDSSSLEIVALPGAPVRYWGRWIRGGEAGSRPLRVVTLRGNELTVVAPMDNSEATFRLRFASAALDSFTGEWTRDTARVSLRGVRRSRSVSAELRAMASAEPFAPSVISTDSGESFGSLSPDGRELYFTRHTPNWARHTIVVSRFDGARWQAPEAVPFSGEYSDREPNLSPDGRQLFFSSNRPAVQGGERSRRRDLWVAERARVGAPWGAPRRLPAPINSDGEELCAVVTRSGTLYFVSQRADTIGSNDIYRARFVNGRYAQPENLGPAVNTKQAESNVYVTPDERVMLLIADARPDGAGGDDIYVSTNEGGVWSPARHLGPAINSFEYDYSPVLSPDGKWLFFTSHRRGTGDIYRVDASVIGR